MDPKRSTSDLIAFAQRACLDNKISKTNAMAFLQDFLATTDGTTPAARCPLRLVPFDDGTVKLPEARLSRDELRTLARYLVLAADGHAID